MSEVQNNDTSEKVKVNLQIAGRPYSFLISPEEEEMVREAHKTLNEKLLRMGNYNFNTPQDALATVALQMTVQYLREKKKDISGHLIRELQFLDSQLDDYIQQKGK